MSRLGTVTLQARDDSDIFLQEDLYLDGYPDFTFTYTEVQADPGFEYAAWETGRVPKVIPVEVDGDATLVVGWIRTDPFSFPFRVKIYLEYEEVETLVIESEEEHE